MGSGRDLHLGSECFISTSSPFCGLFALTEYIVKGSRWCPLIGVRRDQWMPDQTDYFPFSAVGLFCFISAPCVDTFSHLPLTAQLISSTLHLRVICLLCITAVFLFLFYLSLTTPSFFITPPSHCLLCPVSVITLVSFVQCSRLPHFPQNSFPFVSWKLSPTWGQPAEDRCPCAPAGRLKVTWPCRLLWRVWRVTVATIRIYTSGISLCRCPTQTLVPLPLAPALTDLELSTACFPLVLSKSKISLRFSLLFNYYKKCNKGKLLCDSVPLTACFLFSVSPQFKKKKKYCLVHIFSSCLIIPSSVPEMNSCVP